MVNKIKLAWLVIFIFSILSMVLGILAMLDKNYTSGAIFIGMGLMLFVDSFTISFYIKPVDRNPTVKSQETITQSLPLTLNIVRFVGGLLMLLGLLSHLF